MKKELCVIHKKTHHSEGGWRFQTWNTENGYALGWGCVSLGEIKYPEFVPQKIHDERKQYLKSQIQSHRQGELSKEFVELYPEKIKSMQKAGVITKEEVKKAKPVWQDLPGISTVAKTQ